jgi:outer membrane protein assembly factor BamB
VFQKNADSVSRTLAFFIWVLLAVPLLAKSDVVTVSDSFIKTPILYGTHFFGFSDTETFSKFNVSGQSMWRIQDDLSHDHPFEISFNYLFFITRSGNLVAYDVTYGNKIWETLFSDVKAFSIRYPRLFLEMGDTRVRAITFKTGRELWSKEVSDMEWVHPVGRSGVLAVKRKKDVLFLNGITGQQERVMVLPEGEATVVTDWNEGVVLDTGGSYVMSDMESGEFRDLEGVPTLNDTIVEGRYLAQFGADMSVFRYKELPSGELKHSLNLTPTPDSVLFYDRYALLTSSRNIQVLDMPHGEIVFKEVNLPFPKDEALTSFYVTPEKIYVLFDKTLIRVKTESMKKGDR